MKPAPCGHDAAVPAYGRRSCVLWSCPCGKVWAYRFDPVKGDGATKALDRARARRDGLDVGSDAARPEDGS